jgi:mono/diheme cytochrome c family protein
MSYSYRHWVLAAALALCAACRQDMHDQPKYLPLQPSSFFEDQRSARPLPEGTVARGQLKLDVEFYTGKIGAEFTDRFPFTVTRNVFERGQERFSIYCAPCHDRLGYGKGTIVRRGFRQPPSYHIDRLRNVENGYIFDVITNGFGAMPDYAAQIAPRDRWAIVAYVRALQYSQQASFADVPPDRRGELNSGGRQ